MHHKLFPECLGSNDLETMFEQEVLTIGFMDNLEKKNIRGDTHFV